MEMQASERGSPVLVPLEDCREDLVHVGAGTYEEEDDEEKRLEVKKRGLCAKR